MTFKILYRLYCFIIMIKFVLQIIEAVNLNYLIITVGLSNNIKHQSKNDTCCFNKLTLDSYVLLLWGDIYLELS